MVCVCFFKLLTAQEPSLAEDDDLVPYDMMCPMANDGAKQTGFTLFFPSYVMALLGLGTPSNGTIISLLSQG